MKKIIFYFILIFLQNDLLFAKDAWIGIFFEQNNLQLKEKYSLVSDKGSLVTSIYKGSPADFAGLKAGDIIISIDGNTDFSKNTFSGILKEKNPGDILDLEIQKANNEIKNIKLKVGDIKNKNLHRNITKESEKFALYWGGYYVKFAEDKINKIYLNDSFTKKYQTNNAIIVCLDKNSSAYKRGLKIYDEIIEINGKNPFLYKFSNESFFIKVKRDNQIVNIRVEGAYYDGHNSSSAIDLVCAPEFAQYICESKLITFGTRDFDVSLWKEVFNCLEKNKAFSFPFLEKDQMNDTKLEMLYFLLGHYKWNERDNKIYQKYVDITNVEINKLYNLKIKYPDLILSKNYYSLLDMVGSSNFYGKDLNYDRGINIDEKNTTLKFKQLIDEIILNKKTKNIEDLNLINGNLFYLDKVNEDSYLQSILPKLIADNYNIDSENDINEKKFKKDRIEIVISFYDYLLTTYYKKRDISNVIRVHKESINWALKFYQTPNGKVAYAKVLQHGLAKIILLNYNYFNETKSWELIEDYLNKFEQLSVEEQNKILEIDKSYLYDGYFILAVQNTIKPFKKEKLTEYSLRALSEYEKMKGSPEYKIYIYSNILYSAGVVGDDFLINKTLLDIKNYFSSSKGRNEYMQAIKNNFFAIAQFYSNKLLHSELENLINFIDSNFKIKTSGNLDPLESNFALGYLLNKSSVARFKGDYKQALKYLEELVNIPTYDITSVFNDINNGRANSIGDRVFIVTEVLPELFNLYQKNKNFDKMHQLSRLSFDNKNLDDLTKRNLKDVLLVNNPMKVLNALFEYYKYENNKDKKIMIASFINDNIDEISKKKEFGYTPIFAEDFVENIDDFYQIGEKRLFNKIFNAVNLNILESYNDPIFSSVWKSTKNDIHLAVKLLKSSYLSNDEDLSDKAFVTAQIIKSANDTRDIYKGYLAKKSLDNDMYQYHNLQKDITALIKAEEANLSAKNNDKKNQEIFEEKFENKRKSLFELERKLKKTNPLIFQSIKLKGTSLNSAQSKLKENQAILDYYFSEDEVAIFIIKKNSYKIHFEKTNNIKMLKNNIRNSLNVAKNGNIIPFDSKSAFKLNEIVFLSVKKYLDNINYLYIVPHGPLNEIPLHVLPTRSFENCSNCSLVEWNLSDYVFNYLPSLENFEEIEQKDYLTNFLNKNFDKFFSDFNINKNLDNIKTNSVAVLNNIFQLKNENKTEELKNISKIKYLGVGDPDLYSKNIKKDKSIENLNLDRFTALRSFNFNGDIRSINIENIYLPLKSTRDEILYSAKVFGEENSTVWLKENATETNIKENDLRNFNIIHFATHAEVSGAMKGLNEPFLVLTPPKENTEKDNGLLMMNEIMQLNLNADLAILSACNTGSIEDQYSGSYSGLAKAFFVAGAKSVLVSNWFVEDTATQKLIKKFTEKISKANGNFAENLNLTMKELSKQNNQYSHPIFWAPFVFVGTDKEINKNLN